MQSDVKTEENQKLENKLKAFRHQIIHQIEKGKLFGLHHQVRQIQQQLNLMQRI